MCGFYDLLIFFPKVSFFGLINSHIRANRFRGGGRIGDRGGRISKKNNASDFNLKNKIKIKIIVVPWQTIAILGTFLIGKGLEAKG